MPLVKLNTDWNSGKGVKSKGQKVAVSETQKSYLLTNGMATEVKEKEQKQAPSTKEEKTYKNRKTK